MKNLKTGILTLIMVINCVAWAQLPASEQNQQASKTPEQRAAAHSHRLTDKLGLNAEQQKSVYNFCLQHAQQEDADRLKFQNDKTGMKNARQQNEQNFESNLNGVLSTDQKNKYSEMKQERKSMGGYHPSGQQ